MSATDDSNKLNKSKFKFSRRSKIIVAILLVMLTFGVYELGRHGQKWGESNELRAIKSESLASTELLGLELVEATQRGQGDLVGKAVSPGVTRTFRADKDGVDSTKKLIIEFAEREGWVYDRTYQGAQSWRAHKENGEIKLTIIIRDSLEYNNSIEVAVF